MKHLVFYSTNDVFRIEEVLNENGWRCKVVPTPVQDKAYCGVCLEVESEPNISLVQDVEYVVID